MIERKTTYNILDLDFGSFMSQFKSTPSFQNAFTEGIDPTALASGEMVSNFQQSAGVLYQGKTAFDNLTTGYRLGIENNLAKFFIGNTTAYINWDGVSLTISGGVSVTSIDIGGSDSTSAHIDSSGNLWLGDATFAGAPFKVANTGDITAISGTIGGWTLSSSSLSITSGGNTVTLSTGINAFIAGTTGSPTITLSQAGQATFKDVRIGGASIQYQVTNAGIFSFGDGSDGAVDLDGTNTYSFMSKSGSDYTLTRDAYLTDLTVSVGSTLTTNGYRIFGTGTLTNSGTIKWNGNDGSNAPGNGNPAGGSGGAALADGYLKGSGVGGNGGAGNGTNAGSNTTATTNSIGLDATTGGIGGINFDGSSGGIGGVGGTATTSNVKLIANWHLATLLDVASSGSTVKFDNSPSAGGGGGGNRGTCTAESAGGGGGGGSSGGIIAIYFRDILINAAGIIQANGGNGGSGGFGGRVGNGGGGGGAGGNGGQVILVYNTITNNGTLQAAAGTGGIKGDKGSTPGGGCGGVGSATDGTAGSNGNAGNLRQFQISL